MISTDNSDCLFALVSLDSLTISRTFGKKGRGAGEFLMPHILGGNGNGFTIIDNGTQKILRLVGDSLLEVKEKSESDIFNQPHFIDSGIIGYEELSPRQLKLKRYSLSDGEISTILTFPENDVAENSDLFDFVWDAKDDNIVTAHLYTDRFSIRKIESDGIQSSVINVVGDEKFSQNRIVYSGISCGDFIYLLCQTNVDIEDFNGNSVIEKYDYNGNPVAKYVYEGIMDNIILDQEGNRIFFTSTSDENIHYFEL